MTQNPKQSEVEKLLNDAQTALGQEQLFPCRDKKKGEGCIHRLSEERDDEGGSVFWYGIDCKAARERLCDPCLAYWLVACARNIVISEQRLAAMIEARRG